MWRFQTAHHLVGRVGNPGILMRAGHFPQFAWTSSKRFGAGIAMKDSRVGCRRPYDPLGILRGAFTESRAHAERDSESTRGWATTSGAEHAPEWSAFGTLCQYPLPRRQRHRRNEFRPEFMADRIPQPRQFRKQFSRQGEIRVVARAEGSYRRSVGCVVHRDNCDQMMLNQAPRHTQSVDFRSPHIIHLRYPAVAPLPRVFGDHHRPAALGYAPPSRLATRHGHGCTTGGAR